MKRSLCLISFLILAIVLTFGISDGLAKVQEDGKIYTGLGCTETPNGVIIPDSQDPYGKNDIQYNSLGWAYNSNTNDTIIVSCPIVREFTLNPVEKIHITVYNTTDELAQCQIESFTAGGEFVEESAWFYFEPDDSGYPQTIVKSNASDGESFLDLTQTNAGGFYVLQCVLPAGLFDPYPSFTKLAAVATYQVDEAVNK